MIDTQALVGEWRVDLRPAPNAAEYYVTFTVSTVEEKTFQGRFYNSTVQEARMNKAWGTLHFAFLTNDEKGGRYHTTGRLINGKLEGTTHAVDRGFLSYWTAEKVR